MFELLQTFRLPTGEFYVSSVDHVALRSIFKPNLRVDHNLYFLLVAVRGFVRNMFPQIFSSFFFDSGVIGVAYLMCNWMISVEGQTAVSIQGLSVNLVESPPLS